MRLLVNLLTLSVLLAACKSPSKLIEKGNYDKAIEKSVKKLLKGNAKTDDKEMLDKAYKLANDQDNNSIKLLKAEGKPENWEKIYYTYTRLDNRQNKVKKVIPYYIKGKTITYEQVDYTNFIIEAKTNAADYFYAHGNQLMQQGQKELYRQAYHEFTKAKKYRESAYPDITHLIEEARELGITRALVDVSNTTRVDFPGDFYDKLLALNVGNINSTWVEYSFGRTDRTTQYDYYITIDLQNALVSPETYNTRETVRSKKIKDGFEYVLDERGNVRKDSLGNDIKVQKYKTIHCTLIERQQLKEVSLEATISFVSMQPKKTLKRESVSGTSIFKHQSATANGDRNALLTEDLILLRNEPLPFPDDMLMFYDCLEPLKQGIENVLKSNRSLVR